MSPNSLVWLVWTSKGLSIGAILVQWLELFHNLPDEVEFLWNTPLRLITCLYAWSRYFPIFAQGINFAFSVLIRRPSPDPRLCMVTYILKAITGQLATSCLEGILALRGQYVFLSFQSKRLDSSSAHVYALYGQSPTAGRFLSVVMFVGTLLETSGTSLAMIRLQPGPRGNICIPGKIPRITIIMYITGWALTQTVLLVMTLMKPFFHTTEPRTRRGIPVVSLMMRDGVVVFVFIAVVVGGMSTIELRRNDVTLAWPAAFSWYVTLVSIAGCRIIMNMRKLAARPAQTRPTNLFSSIDAFELSYFSRPSNSLYQWSMTDSPEVESSLSHF